LSHLMILPNNIKWNHFVRSYFLSSITAKVFTGFDCIYE
jgi:hypothetical protein